MLIQHYGKQAIDGDVNFDLCFPGFLAFVFSSFCAFREFWFLGFLASYLFWSLLFWLLFFCAFVVSRQYAAPTVRKTFQT